MLIKWYEMLMYVHVCCLWRLSAFNIHAHLQHRPGSGIWVKGAKIHNGEPQDDPTRCHSVDGGASMPRNSRRYKSSAWNQCRGRHVSPVDKQIGPKHRWQKSCWSTLCGEPLEWEVTGVVLQNSSMSIMRKQGTKRTVDHVHGTSINNQITMLQKPMSTIFIKHPPQADGLRRWGVLGKAAQAALK